MLTKTERDKKRALNEARRAGKILPEIDQNGNVINPHIPEFMANAPWYLGQQEGEGLLHQKKMIKEEDAPAKIGTWYKRGKETLNDGNNSKSSSGSQSLAEKGVKSSSSSLFTKSSNGNDDASKRGWKTGCKNCGSRTHNEKDCLERPRKIGAWKSGKDIQPDEAEQVKLKFTYDGARDRYNGYDPSQQLRTIMLHQMAEKERKKRKREEKKAKEKEEENDDKSKSESSSDSSDSDSDSSSSSSSSSSGNSTSKDKKAPIVPAGSRVRSDTAKYLYNLDPDSAFYDPKTRSMRGNPFPDTDPNSVIFAGDNFVKQSSEAVIDTTKFPL